MPNILTLDEAAELTRTSANTLRYWRNQGTGPHSFKLGRRVMYREDDVVAWMQAAYDDGARRDTQPA